jgi:hypothetical protein
LPSKETSDAVAFYANVATLVAAPLGLIGLWVAICQLSAGRNAASAAAVIALNESLRQAWLHFVQTTDGDKRQHAFADIVNLLESACAIDDDMLFVGSGGTLLGDYILHQLKLIEQSDDALQRIEKMFVTEKTFLHISNYLRRRRGDFKRLRIPLVATDPKGDHVDPASP